MNQLDLHKKIGEFFKAGTGTADVDVAQSLLVNEDAKRFFFYQADESWLGWLWDNSFLNELNKKAEDPTKYRYSLSELEYLKRMSVKDPAKVVEIILDKETATRGDNFNPEVVDRFLSIIVTLPPEKIKMLTVKILDEKWVYLMRTFFKTGYEFEKIIEKLVEGEENSAILELAQAVLVVKSKEEISENGNSFNMDPFYVSDLSASGIFEALANIQEPYKEKALQITTDTMREIVELSDSDETKVFEYMDLFALYDVDFFTLEIEDKIDYSHQDDIKKLAATIKKLVEKTIGEKCSDANEIKKLFKNIDKLPSCRSVWRLRLFVLTRCPKVFNKELKEAFFKLFEVENYYEIEGGTEYKKALKVGFPYLSDIDQRSYVANVLRYFSEKAKKDPDKSWIKRTGWEILSSICDYLKEDEAKKCEEFFDSKCDREYKPKPSGGEIRSGFASPVSPVNNLENFTIGQIITNLKSEWTPEKLSEQFKDDDFLNPRGAEGLGNTLKEDVKKRTSEYLNNINSFFGRDTIHPHYMYSLLRGIEEMLRNKQSLSLEQISQIFGLFEVIKDEGVRNPFKRKDDKSWLTDWVTVHTVITDILLTVLSDKTIKDEVHKEHRDQIKNIISYLLKITDSPSKENKKPEYDDEPYSVAINSVRGRAYEAFVVFTENDGKTLASDIKEIYKEVLLDDSIAIRFVIGRYLASFYFRDEEFIVGLFPDIFPKDDPEKKDIYLASWEGYLSNTLYDKLFDELKGYYSHAITLDPKDYTQRKYSKGLDESLAIHLALAFIYLGLEMSDSLFIQFWNTPNTKRHKEFISFIGRSILTRDKAGEGWLKENKVSKEKLIKFWSWALENVSELEAFSGFGYWINPDKEIIDEKIVVKNLAITLKRSEGNIDWDYGLTRRLKAFAEIDPTNTLELIQYFLLHNGELNTHRRVPLFSIDSEIKEALEIIYKNNRLKSEVEKLVNTLIEKGSSLFWGLKEVIK